MLSAIILMVSIILSAIQGSTKEHTHNSCQCRRLSCTSPLSMPWLFSLSSWSFQIAIGGIGDTNTQSGSPRSDGRMLCNVKSAVDNNNNLRTEQQVTGCSSVGS